MPTYVTLELSRMYKTKGNNRNYLSTILQLIEVFPMGVQA